METNPHITQLNEVIKSTKSLFDKLKSGEGFGLTEEQRKEYKKQIDKLEVQEKFAEFEKKLAELNKVKDGNKEAL